MSDPRVEKMARILVEHSLRVRPGDKISIEGTTLAEPLLRALYRRVLEQGGHPHLLVTIQDQDELFYAAANDDQLDFTPAYHQLAAETFDGRIRIASDFNTRALTHLDPALLSRRSKALSPIQRTVFRRTAAGEFRWVGTLFPTQAYAMEAEMGFEAYQDFVYRACHCDDATPDPVAYWQGIERRQDAIVRRFTGHDKIALRGPNVDLTLSVKGRTWLNAAGIVNLPDGEIYTGPVEDSANGWVRFTYPAVYGGRVVEGAELTFENGRVVKATAEKNEALLHQMLDLDEGARYLGEFAIGTNYEIDRATRMILFDEKIGGSFHLACGASYPESGGKNVSALHWDMICDLKTDSEITLDGEVVYRNGSFID